MFLRHRSMPDSLLAIVQFQPLHGLYLHTRKRIVLNHNINLSKQYCNFCIIIMIFYILYIVQIRITCRHSVIMCKTRDVYMFLNEDKSRLPNFFYLFYCLNWLQFDVVVFLWTFDFLFDMKNIVLYDLACFLQQNWKQQEPFYLIQMKLRTQKLQVSMLTQA